MSKEKAGVYALRWKGVDPQQLKQALMECYLAGYQAGQADLIAKIAKHMEEIDDTRLDLDDIKKLAEVRA